MPIGITNVTNVSYENITSIANITNPADFFINVNTYIFQGWFFFIMLVILWIILYVVGNERIDQPLQNAMYGGAAVTILSLILRGVEISNNGVVNGLLTDWQLWIFPLITIILALILWATKE